MAAKNHIALYYASHSLGEFLSDSYGKRKTKESEPAESGCEMVSAPSNEEALPSSESEPAKNVWEIVGVHPSEGMGISDQMLTNGNYFTCYACADTYALLSAEREGAPEAWGTLEERRRAYAELLNKAKRNFSLARHKKTEGFSPKKRDQSGRLRYGDLDRVRIDEKFCNEWIFPRLSEDAVKELGEAVDRGAAAEQGSIDAALGRIAERILDEAKFYEDLYENRVHLDENLWDEDSDERRKLDCFRVLVPIWVYTQCCHANSSVNGIPLDLPLNLYNVNFWEDKDAVAGLVEELCERFLEDGQLSGRVLVKKFEEVALELANACANDIQTIEDDFKQECQKETLTIRELFEESLSGKLLLKDWAKWRGALIWLIIVSCCVSIQQALEGVKSMIPAGPTDLAEDSALKGLFDRNKNPVGERKTSDCLEGDESLLDANELGRGSGSLPLHISEGNCDLPSMSLRLAADAPKDEVLCVLGHAYESCFWEVYWQKIARKLLGDFFIPEVHLGSREKIGAGEPGPLLARLWKTTESLDLRGLSRVEAVALGELDVVGELRLALASRFFDCLEKSFSDEGVGHGPELVLDSPRGGTNNGTLIGAVRAAVNDVCELISIEWKKQMKSELAKERQEREKAAESRSEWRPTNVRNSMLERLLRGTREYFEEQGVLGWGSKRAGGELSQLEALFRQLEQAYKKGLGQLGRAYEEEFGQWGQAYKAGFGSDPSMRFALARVRRELSGRLERAIRLDDVWDVVKTVFTSVAKAEKEAFIPLSLSDVSARHAVLYLESGRLMVADAGSLNGTAVIRQSPDGAVKGEGPRRFVLRGSERTRVERIVEVTDGLGGDPETVDALPLCRGDVVRLAGRTAIGVGNRL